MIGEAIVGFVVEVVGQVVVMLVLRYPGAVLIHSITRFRKPFKYWLNERAELSGWIGLLAFVAGMIIKALF